MRDLLAIIRYRLVGEGLEALIGMAVRLPVAVGTMGVLMTEGLGVGKDLLRETRVEAVLLREAGIGEARLGEIRIGKVLIEARLGEARVAPPVSGKLASAKF